MTKEDIFKWIIAAFIGAFTKPIIDAYMPSKDQIKIYVKRVLNILLSYLLPIFLLAEAFFDNSPINKSFLFRVILFSGVLILNITVALYIKLSSKISSQRDDTVEAFKKVIEGFGGIHKEQIELTQRLVDLIGDRTELYNNFNNKTLNALEAITEKVKELENSNKKK